VCYAGTVKLRIRPVQAMQGDSRALLSNLEGVTQARIVGQQILCCKAAGPAHDRQQLSLVDGLPVVAKQAAQFSPMSRASENVAAGTGAQCNVPCLVSGSNPAAGLCHIENRSTGHT
jgi:hypothetical protein